METEKNWTKTQFWILWSLLSMGIITASYLLSLIAVLLVHGAFGFNMEEWGTPLSNTLMQIAGGAVIGAGTGLYQKSLLKRLFKVGSSWIYTLIIGFVATELVTGIILWQMGLIRGQLRFLEFNPLPESLIFAGIGLLTGLLQWAILKKSFSGSFYWIIASTAGWWLCIFSAYLLGLVSRGGSILGFIPGTFLYGAITGAILLWVMKPKNA